LPLALQRALAPPPSPLAPAAPRIDRPPAVQAPVPVPTWPLPTVQRWPDLRSVQDTGRGLLAGARDTVSDRAGAGATSLLARGRDLAGEAVDGATGAGRSALRSLGANAPDLPSLPGAPALPDVPGLPGVPDMPLAPSLPSLPAMGSLPNVPGIPSIPSRPGVPSLPAVPEIPPVPAVPSLPAVPGAPGMTEISFPQPSDGGGGGGGAAAPAPPAASGGAAGGDLDELAHKLYDRIRWRLRSELRLDMERSGLGAGVRR
jgi:hypothetical protein